MKTAVLLACCLLIIPLSGTVTPETVRDPGRRPCPPETSAQRKALLANLYTGSELFRASRFPDAAAQFRSVAADASALRDFYVAGRATSNLGGCLFALHQYQPALAHFMEGRRLAHLTGDLSVIAIIDTNIASLYSEMGDFDSAGRWIEGARERLAGADRRHLPQVLIQLATVRSRQQRMAEAFELFREAIRLADRAGDLNLYAVAWNRWGEELLKHHDLAGAERALLEAYRVRKLHHLGLEGSYRNLGRLRLEQGDLLSASALLDRAVELTADPRGQIPTWDLYHYRGRVRLAQGRLREALADLRTAVRLGRAWRWPGASDDAVRIGEEGWLDRVHSALIEAGNRLYRLTGDKALLRETFDVLEENRASSLRKLRAGGTSDFREAESEALLQRQREEVQAVRSGRASTAPVSSGLMDRAQASLPANAALLSFQLGDRVSWLWVMDRCRAELYQLPPRDVIETEVQAAARAIGEGRDESAASVLYAALFGQMAVRFRRKERWILALDNGLFDAPLAALVTSRRTRPVYLVESHSLQVIPGAGWWTEESARPLPPPSHLFVGIGDPVYNAADERLPGTPAKSPFHVHVAELVLPRLVASGRELDDCAAAWRGEHRVLKGAAACRRNLVLELGRNPSVVHFAAHVLQSSGKPAEGMIALSLGPRGDTQFLRPEEIAQWRIQTGLIVLSGCRSASGEQRPGTGLLGLTRAWVAAGAADVIGSRWPTVDDSGTLFRTLYRHLRAPGGAGPAKALRDAQIEMLRSGDWHANPRYWGAYFSMGIEATQ